MHQTASSNPPIASSRDGSFAPKKLKAANRLIGRVSSATYKPITDVLRPFAAEVLLPKVETALQKAKDAQIFRFDPYLISGYAPSENEMSDALRMILDPSGVHGLALEGLRALLESARDTAGSLAEKVRRVETTLQTSSSIRVYREFSVNGGRIDIRISGGTDFLIFVEAKKPRDAFEIGATPQTVRYEKELRKAEAAGVVGLGLYLTPDEKRAKSNFFIPISYQQFAICLRARLSDKGLALSEDTRTMLGAFTLTYGWLN